MSELLQSALSDAIAEAVGGLDEMVLKWVAVVETIGADGTRGVWTVAQEDSTAWDALGLLAYATQREKAEMTAQRLDDGA